MPGKPIYINRHEAANLLGLAEQTLRCWAVYHYGPPFQKARGHVRYLRSDVLAFAASQGKVVRLVN